MNTLAKILFFILLLGFSYMCWVIGRDLNYSWAYKSKVQETVREMVKEEALKDASK